jgi:inhibitor of cysteine peptidase
MAKQGKIGFTIILLSMLILGAACTPLIGAGDDGSTDETAPIQAAPQVNVTVDEVELQIMESFPIQVAAVVRGHLPDGCTVLDDISAAREGNTFVLDIAAHREGDMCTMALVPFEKRVALDVEGLKAGTYQVVGGDASAAFTFDVDNVRADGAPVEYVRDLRGTVTAIVYGTDGVQVELTAGDTVYSVTISAMQAEVEGRWDRIAEQSEIVVSGPVVAGAAPPLIVAERVTVLGSE